MNCIYHLLYFVLYATNPVSEASFITSDISNIFVSGTLSLQDTLEYKTHESINYSNDEGPNGDSDSSSFWQLEFIDREGSKDSGTVIFQFEVLVNRHFQGRISGKPDFINAELNRYRRKLDNTDVLNLILINTDYLKFDIKSANGSYTTNDQEVCFYFNRKHPTRYTVQLPDESTQIEDFFFFYIEKSNGIENLRDVRDRIEPLIGEKSPFLAYFHGPDNNAIIVSHENEPYRLDEFFNILFTSRTQPPLVPNDELLNVYSTLSKFVYENHHRINLKMYLYFNEASYSFLLEPFIIPLLETRIPKLNLLNWHVSIISDFNIQPQNDQYTYINLVNQ